MTDADHPIRTARRALKLTQTEFGEAIALGKGVAAQVAVSRLESGWPLELSVAHRIVTLCRDHGLDLRLEDFLRAPSSPAPKGEAAA